MILIITHKLDFTADFLINKLNQQNIAYRRFNCEDVLTNDFSFSYNPHFNYSFLGQQDFKTVWFRRTMLPDVDMKSIEEKNYILKEAEAFLKNLFSVIDAKWISPPINVYHAENKLYQLKIAEKLGFKIPDTLITSNKSELVRFYNRHDRIIVKPLSQTRISSEGNVEFIFTNRVETLQMDKISEYDLTPCIFQEEIEKDVELRITVVNNTVFTAQVKSQQDNETKIDWRRKKLIFTRYELPEPVQQLCVKMVKKLGLLFGAIDMIVSPDGTYTFLEINPNGQWVWIESETGLGISDALIKELTDHGKI